MGKEKKYEIDLKRAGLIRQLRYALGQVESPRNTVVEFDIFETTFEVEFDE